MEQTNIPAHLEQMLVMLQEEEMTSERGMYGPCLEYLLQHKLLDTLYSLGRADVGRHGVWVGWDVWTLSGISTTT